VAAPCGTIAFLIKRLTGHAADRREYPEAVIEASV
jgi:hypothetical protein